jgi:hypothetical protein
MSDIQWYPCHPPFGCERALYKGMNLHVWRALDGYFEWDCTCDGVITSGKASSMEEAQQHAEACAKRLMPHSTVLFGASEAPAADEIVYSSLKIVP